MFANCMRNCMKSLILVHIKVMTSQGFFMMLMLLLLCLLSQPDSLSVFTISAEDSMIAAGNYRLFDIDGNKYKVVKIGTQVWMAENLKTTRFNDGTFIPDQPGGLSEELISPYFCWYRNDSVTFKSYYGALYNWYTLDSKSNGGKELCPTGWHIPSDEEWTILTDYLTSNGYGYQGSGNDIGKSMASNSSWGIDRTDGNVGNDQVSNNTSGFSAVPSGYRLSDGKFGSLGFSCSWWSSTGFSYTGAYFRSLAYRYNYTKRDIFDKRSCFSIRCLKDL